MTGYAALSKDFSVNSAPYNAQWDIRAVNGRGLDLRFRLPDWLDGLEPALRKIVANTVNRGSVSVSIKLYRAESVVGMRLNPAALAAAVDLVIAAETQAESRGLGLAPMTAADLLTLKGVIDTGPEAVDAAAMIRALLAQAPEAIAAFEATRWAEGQAMQAVIAAQLDTLAALTLEARAALGNRRGAQLAALKAALARVTEAAPTLDPARLEQELALIALRTDITEELDRLDAHTAATRALLEAPEPVGRKLDFLVQEFNREANTLCAKAQNGTLTRIGLDLKTIIDQMREQIQNLE